MRTVRWLLSLAVAGSAALIGDTSAYAAAPTRSSLALADVIAVSASPSTVNPGSRVRITAFCRWGEKASASSDLAGMPEVDLTPGYGGLTGTTTVPSKATSGQYKISVVCDNGDRGSTSLSVVGGDVPSTGPHTGGGGLVNGSRPSDSGVALLAGGILALVLAGILFVRRRRAA